MKKRLIITAAIAALLLAGGCSGGTKKTDTDGSVVIDWGGTVRLAGRFKIRHYCGA